MAADQPAAPTQERVAISTPGAIEVRSPEAGDSSGSGCHRITGASTMSVPLNTPSEISLYGHGFSECKDLRVRVSPMIDPPVTVPAKYVSSTEITLWMPALRNPQLALLFVMQEGKPSLYEAGKMFAFGRA